MYNTVSIVGMSNSAKLMPAEWHEHECTWMVYPTSSSAKSTWKIPTIALVRDNFVSVVRAVAGFEPVKVLAESNDDKEDFESKINTSEFNRESLPFPITVTVFKTNDMWVRDIGPTFCVPHPVTSDASDTTSPTSNDKNTQSLVAIDWVFNGWGGKCSKSKYRDDNLCAAHIASVSASRTVDGKVNETMVLKSDLMIEGGSIHSDGEGNFVF